jgi:uncharacterized membrane protein YeiH
MSPLESQFLGALSLVGTFAFAISGALLAVRRRMDVFGALVLAYVTASAGGIMRDLAIGAVPPEAFQTWHLLAVIVVASLLTFYAAPLVDRLRYPIALFDAAGLGIFAVDGTQKALQFGIDPVMAGVLGLVTGIGGGVLRDMLAARQPLVLATDFYASAALAAVLVMLLADALGVQSAVLPLGAVLLCFGLRVLALYGHWHLPASPWTGQREAGPAGGRPPAPGPGAD